MPLKPPARMHQVYSLWMVPEDKAFESYSQMISTIAKAYNCPEFNPHITLLSGFTGNKTELIQQTSLLGPMISPLKVCLNAVDYEPVYYKSLYLEAKLTPKLIEAHSKATKLFGVQSDTKFHPHLSLAYGLELGKQAAGNLDKSLFREFSIKALTLVSTKGMVNEWFEVFRYET